MFLLKLNPNVNYIQGRKWQGEGGKASVAAIECAWLLQLTDNWWSPTLKSQAICIPSSSFSEVFSSIGKILLQGHVGIPPLLCVFTLKLYTTLHLNERQTSGIYKGNLEEEFHSYSAEAEGKELSSSPAKQILYSPCFLLPFISLSFPSLAS